MSCSRLSSLENLASALVAGASMELHLTPKPGLVDLHDSGSHPDLSLALMEKSIGHIDDYLASISTSLQCGETFPAQQAIAIGAERRLIDELGTNTHKGYLFLSGMLLIAQWHSANFTEQALRQSLSTLARDFFLRAESSATHGNRARHRFKAGGIVREAVDAYPSLFEAALPAFRKITEEGACPQTAAFAMLACLMQTVEDTTTLHRGGLEGLARIRRDGRMLEKMIWQGDDFRPFLSALNRTYIQHNLTIGGVADMLGIGYGCLIASGELAIDQAEIVSLAVAA